MIEKGGTLSSLIYNGVDLLRLLRKSKTLFNFSVPAFGTRYFKRRNVDVTPFLFFWLEIKMGSVFLFKYNYGTNVPIFSRKKPDSMEKIGLPLKPNWKNPACGLTGRF